MTFDFSYPIYKHLVQTGRFKWSHLAIFWQPPGLPRRRWRANLTLWRPCGIQWPVPPWRRTCYVCWLERVSVKMEEKLCYNTRSRSSFPWIFWLDKADVTRVVRARRDALIASLKLRKRKAAVLITSKYNTEQCQKIGFFKREGTWAVAG